MPMRIKGGAAFVHVPKTGGSWVRACLRNAGIARGETGRRHGPVGEARAGGAGFVFAFVRDPASWLQSAWAYGEAKRERGDPAAWGDWRGMFRFPEDGRFSTFIDRYLAADPGFVSKMFDRLTDGADFVGRQETLCVDLVRALSEAGVPYCVGRLRGGRPRKVVSRSPEWTDRVRYDPAALAAVRDAEAWGIRRWGYSGDPGGGAE